MIITYYYVMMHTPGTHTHTQTFKQEYKDRLSAISNLVLVKFTEDTMVQPKDSEVSLWSEKPWKYKHQLINNYLLQPVKSVFYLRIYK